jgi:hypothetical protein
MASTYEPIGTTTTSTAVTSVSFTSIPTTYDDLVLIANANYTSGSGDLNIRFNSDSGSTSYAYIRQLNGTPIQVGVSTGASSAVLTDNTPNSIQIIDVFEYKNTSVYKTFMNRGGNVTNNMGGVAGVWKSNNAIHTVTFHPEFSGSTWAIGSTFTIYGIKKA